MGGWVIAMEQVPVLHVLAGPNGSGKSTYAERVLVPQTHLPFVNADLIAAATWPGAAVEHGYEAARLAADERARLIGLRRSFVTETVFSHPSKVDLIGQASETGYQVLLHVLLVPEELSVARVAHRVRRGGHAVPEDKIRSRYRRLWTLIAEARARADRAWVLDNSVARTPFRLVATYEAGRLTGSPAWPAWTPEALRN